MAVDIPNRDTNRPYPPASNVTTVLHRLRSRNLPDRIDQDFLRDAGISESLVHRVAFALRFLGLVENDVPTPALRSISTSTDEEYRELLADLLRTAYSEVFAVVDPAEDSQDRIVNFFRRYTPASQRERMVNFFLSMCREAGIPISEAPRQRPSGESPRPRQSAKARPAPSKTIRAASEKKEGERKGTGDGASPLVEGVPPALELLIRSLPPMGTPMTATRREQWLSMAEAALAFVYPEEADVEREPVNKED